MVWPRIARRIGPPRQRRAARGGFSALIIIGLLNVAGIGGAAEENHFIQTASPLLKQFCWDCHGQAEAEANVNLERLTANPAFSTTFKTWRKVVSMLEQQKMPPQEAPQPSAAQRRELATLVRDALRRSAEQQADDPGP